MALIVGPKYVIVFLLSFLASKAFSLFTSAVCITAFGLDNEQITADRVNSIQ